MKTFIALAIGLAVLPQTLPATQISGPTMEVRPGIPASEGELTSAVQEHVTRGDVLTGLRRYGEAQQEFRSAAAIARREGHLASRSLWHLACAFYYEGDIARAVATLDELRREAVRFGDLRVEALALFNAAWLDGQAGRYAQAQSRVTQLQRLLGSPYMPIAIRDHLTARLNTPGEIAVRP
jgi:tetratricopeptide (TPR) repeat protein